MSKKIIYTSTSGTCYTSRSDIVDFENETGTKPSVGFPVKVFDNSYSMRCSKKVYRSACGKYEKEIKFDWGNETGSTTETIYEVTA